jgi:RNA polymerase sigma-70 factor (ECF subfamily)
VIVANKRQAGPVPEDGIEKSFAGCHNGGRTGEQGVDIMEAVSLMTDESDRATFSQMARDHHRLLLVYARTLVRDEGDARELVQDALLAAWKNLKKFDVTRDRGAWLRGIVRNKWRDYCRHKGRRPLIADEELVELEADLSAWERDRQGPVFDALQECRDKLPEAFSEAVEAFYYEGLSGEEAAEHLGVQPGTFRKRLERARAVLHDCLESEN